MSCDVSLFSVAQVFGLAGLCTVPAVSQVRAEQNQLIDIDRHVILVVDRSSSMNTNDSIGKAMKGYAESLVYDEEIKMQMHSGIRFAFSLVFFAHAGKHTVTEMIVDHDMLVRFAQDNLWDFNKGEMASLPIMTDGTAAYQAYITVDRLISNEARYGFRASSRIMLMTGDEAEPYMCSDIKEMTKKLSLQYNTVVHALPAMATDNYYHGYESYPVMTVQAFYNDCIRTQEGSYYLAKNDLRVPVSAGVLTQIGATIDYRASLRRAVNLVVW